MSHDSTLDCKSFQNCFESWLLPVVFAGLTHVLFESSPPGGLDSKSANHIQVLETAREGSKNLREEAGFEIEDSVIYNPK